MSSNKKNLGIAIHKSIHSILERKYGQNITDFCGSKSNIAKIWQFFQRNHYSERGLQERKGDLLEET